MIKNGLYFFSLSEDKASPSGPAVNDCIVSRIRPSPSYRRSYDIPSPALIRGQQQPQPHTNVIFTGLECKMLWPSGGEEDGCHQPQLLLPAQGYCKSKLLVSRSYSVVSSRLFLLLDATALVHTASRSLQIFLVLHPAQLLLEASLPETGGSCSLPEAATRASPAEPAG